MKMRETLIALFAVVSFGAFAQNNDLTITAKNQQQNGTSMTFDVYASTSSGTTYIADADFVVSTNATKWSSLSASLSNINPDFSNMSASIVGGDVVLNIQAPFSATVLGDFPAVSTTPVRIATITLTDVSDFTALPAFANVGSGNPSTQFNEAYVAGNGRLRQKAVSNLTVSTPSAGTAPSVVTNFAADFSTSGQATLSWDAIGGADSVLIVARDAAAVTTGPANTITYAGNLAFGSGAELGSGNNEYVIGKFGSAATSATVTGLSSGSTYHFAIYAYSGGGGFSEAYSAGVTASGVTLFAEPTVAASNLAFSNVATTGFDLSWTSGDGDSVLVVVREDATAQAAPADGTAYPPSGTTGAGNDVVYAQVNTTSASITGLTAGTFYTVEIYEYNGQGSSANYLTSSIGAASQFTMFTEPTTVATNMVFSNVAGTSFDVSWTGGNGDSTLVVARLTSDAAVAPTDGTGYADNATFTSGDGSTTGTGNVVLYSGPATTSITATGLTAGVDYTIEVYEFNGAQEYSNYNATALSGAQTTQFNAPTAATNIAFSNYAQTSFDVSWTAGTGSNVMVVVREAANAAVAPSNGTGYSANTNFTSSDGDVTGAGNIVLFAGASQTSLTVSGLTAGTEYSVDVYDYNGSGVTANYATALTGTQYTVFAEPSTALAGITATATSANAIDVTWTDPSEAANQWMIVARLSTDAATAPTNATAYTANTAYASGDALGNGYVVYNGDGTSGSVSVTGLDQNETYAFDIYAFTGNGASDLNVINYSDAAEANGSDVTWLQVDLAAILEGPYDGTDMSSVNITVPSAQPYNTAAFGNYNGGETNGSMPANVVDWVLLELRSGASAASATTVEFTQAALLLADGSIVAADGSSLPEFEITAEGTYYVGIRHRNHLGAYSATALVDNGASAFSYNFSTAGAIGIDPMYDYNGDGSVYVLFGGWADNATNSVIDAGDNAAVYNDRNTSPTYGDTDVNLDGAVNAADRAMVFNNRDYSEQTPQ